MEQPLFISTDERKDVAGSIRHVLRCMEFVRDDQQAWKWLYLAMHSALQGACICHLTTTAAPVGAVEKQNAKEWLHYFEESRNNPDLQPPATRLMSLPDLLKAVRKPNSSGGPSKRVSIQINDEELRWLSRLHKVVRNQFTHFEPSGFTIDVSGMPQVGKVTARIIKDIVNAGWAFRHFLPDETETMRQDLETLREASWMDRLDLEGPAKP